jgi:hypothetical protein
MRVQSDPTAAGVAPRPSKPDAVVRIQMILFEPFGLWISNLAEVGTGKHASGRET